MSQLGGEKSLLLYQIIKVFLSLGFPQIGSNQPVQLTEDITRLSVLAVSGLSDSTAGGPGVRTENNSNK